MLYKKIHRQFLREFRKGRRFEYRLSNSCIGFYKVYEIESSPHIDIGNDRIRVCSSSNSVYNYNPNAINRHWWDLILMEGQNLGRLQYKDKIFWRD